MITPAREDFEVYRHAAFPSVDPFILTDETTGLPIDLTGATITMVVRLFEGDDTALLTKTLAVVSGPAGRYGPPVVSEAEHEALAAAKPADIKNQRSQVGLVHDIKFAGVPNFPASFIGLYGDYVVRTGVNT